MDKKDSIKGKEIKRSSLDQEKRRNPSNKIQIKEKKLPWWVELLFVQIGLPDKWLIKLLKTKKEVKEIYRNEKKIIFALILFIFTIGYIQPVIRYSRTKLLCQKTFKDYMLKIKPIQSLKDKELKMLSVNFCNGGEEIDNLNNLQ
tara:strand:+ start:1960 stop:2394 length:435 start_codon:yes stop_codon:yes gene_type:complete